MYPGSHVESRSTVRKCISVRATIAGHLAGVPISFPSFSVFLFLMLPQFHRRNDDVSVDTQLAVLSQLPGAAAGNLAAAAVARCSTSAGFAARNVAMLLPCSYLQLVLGSFHKSPSNVRRI